MKFAASILLFAFLMAVRDDVENHYLRMMIAAGAGASLALVMANSKGRRERASRPPQQRWDRGPLWIATVLYVVSWFLPVIKDGWTLDRGLPGWQALTTVLHPLWDTQELAERPWFSLLSIASGLTNLFMLAALVRIHARPTPAAKLWMWAALLAAALNASWIGFDWADQSFRVGYFCWCLSFVFLLVSLAPRGVRTEAIAAQARDA